MSPRPGDASDSDAERPQAHGVVEGQIVEQLPQALYKVRLDAGQVVVAHIADRVDRNFIRLLVGDRVRLALSPVDRGRGRITAKG